MRNIFIVLLGLFVGGCSIGQTLDEARGFKDDEAKLLLAGQCAAGRGATNRMFKDTPNKLAALDLLCDGHDPGKQPPTLDAGTLEVLRLLLAPRQPVPE